MKLATKIGKVCGDRLLLAHSVNSVILTLLFVGDKICRWSCFLPPCLLRRDNCPSVSSVRHRWRRGGISSPRYWIDKSIDHARDFPSPPTHDETPPWHACVRHVAENVPGAGRGGAGSERIDGSEVRRSVRRGRATIPPLLDERVFVNVNFGS